MHFVRVSPDRERLWVKLKCSFEAEQSRSKCRASAFHRLELACLARSTQEVPSQPSEEQVPRMRGGICERNRIKSTCKSCGVASICEYSRKRSQCQSCGVASICEHGFQRGKCKRCGGFSFCPTEPLLPPWLGVWGLVESTSAEPK